ncbi:hypothetical protein ACJIZ3_023839 [Penstemon smallii]|uniref:EF-hand domain-containing protein n=1 Tax=Penstemon smallii TaxID=265156 RepID=A0ABD3TSM4_9LAMI
MIAILLASLLFIFGLICTFSSIPKTNKFLSTWFPNHHKSPSQVDASKPSTTLITSSNTKTNTRNIDSRADRLRDVFATFDKNNDGFITKKELRDSLKNIGISAGEKEVSDMVEKVDLNRDGLIDFDEFCELFESISSNGGNVDEERGGDDDDEVMKEAFDVFDENKDGLITVEELGLVLSSLGFTQGNKLEDCKEMIRKVDINGDGMVSFDEFKTMMKSGSIGRFITVS